jgi:hypothetical protein
MHGLRSWRNLPTGHVELASRTRREFLKVETSTDFPLSESPWTGRRGASYQISCVQIYPGISNLASPALWIVALPMSD